jgi:predicted ATPase
VLTPDQIAGLLDTGLALLSPRSRTVPARQQTVRQTLAWSYELLDSEERSLFEQLSTFAGGWTLEAAHAVFGGP